MSAYKPYPKTKDSGVEWLGNMPEEWAFSRLKHVVDPVRSITYGIVQAGPDIPGGIPYVRPADMSDEGGVTDPDGIMRTSSEIAASYTRSAIRTGDLVCSIGPSFGKVMVVPEWLEGGNLTQGTARVAVSRFAHARFFYWILLSEESYGQWESSIGGATFRALNLGSLAETYIPLPPLPEQRQVAAFLDRECGKLDVMQAKQERLIELLKEKRQALISHAVTRGLDPTAKLKPSGIEWLGEVPEDWRVGKCGFYLSILSGFAFPSAGFTQDESQTKLLRGINVGVSRIKWDETVYWQRSENDGLGCYELKAGDLVVGMDRPWISEGVRVAKISEDDLPCLLLQRVTSLKTSSLLSTDYLFRILSSEMFVAYFTPDTTGVSVPHLSPDQICDFVIPIPPLAEQRAIVAHLDEKCGKIDQLKAKAERGIELLKERRSALISAAVTGKIDVRTSLKQTVLA